MTDDGTHGLSCLKMNMLFGTTMLAGFISSNSSFPDLQASGSLLFTGEKERRQDESGTEKQDSDNKSLVHHFWFDQRFYSELDNVNTPVWVAPVIVESSRED